MDCCIVVLSDDDVVFVVVVVVLLFLPGTLLRRRQRLPSSHSLSLFQYYLIVVFPFLPLLCHHRNQQLIAVVAAHATATPINSFYSGWLLLCRNCGHCRLLHHRVTRHQTPLRALLCPLHYILSSSRGWRRATSAAKKIHTKNNISTLTKRKALSFGLLRSNGFSFAPRLLLLWWGHSKVCGYISLGWRSERGEKTPALKIL